MIHLLVHLLLYLLLDLLLELLFDLWFELLFDLLLELLFYLWFELLSYLLFYCFLLLPYQLRTRYKKATEERIDEIRKKIGPGSEKKKFTPDLFMEENDGSYRAPEKTKKQIDFEREVDWRRRRKQRRKVFVPDEKQWDISIDEDK